MDCKRRAARKIRGGRALGLIGGCGLAIVAGLAPLRAASTEPASRIVSINLCTDQLVMALAEPRRIAAVSWLARGPELSFLAGQARGLRTLPVGAEAVLALKPDLVLAGAFSAADTRSLLQRQGLRVETFAPVTTLEDARQELRRAATLLGEKARGDTILQEIESKLAQSRGVGRGLTALAYERRGFAAGKGTLLDELMTHMGLANAAASLGLASVGAMPLEAVVSAKPDVLIVDWHGAAPPDQGTALLLHPALLKTVPASRHVALPASLITCAGPALPRAIDRLAAEIRRVRSELHR